MVTVDLDDTSNCPVGRVCEACGKTGRSRRVWTVESQVGMGCTTLCSRCSKAGVPSVAVSSAVMAAMAHCEHLGITVDEMAALMKRSDKGTGAK